jgi:DNA-binding transcriptional LysR family regulator
LKVDPTGPLVCSLGNGTDILVAAAVAGTGVIYLFEDLLRSRFESGTLVPILEPWWLRFPGPFLYYSSRLHMPPPLRAFVDFVRQPSSVK